MSEHTALITNVKPNAEKFIRGEFDYENGKLNFTCSTSNVTFTEVEEALMALVKEVQRQIDNKHKCPFYKGK